MALTAGARLGPYEIVSPVGAGGMGEVYRARDTRLDRTVAIKVLSESLAADPIFRDRFDREARVISQLDHPHICTLYDVGEQHGTAYLVMQYLEGETLEARVNRGPLPLEHALQYAIHIADALDKAHRAGILHRDLKPGNIMLTKSGATLLDFGLAKPAVGPVVAGLSKLPTTSPSLTAQGTILGTLQYMSPEQLEGHEADSRSDIFAFGAVLYEMVTGRKAFEGKSQASIIGAIMHADPPPISTLQRLAPPLLDHLARTCLAKNPDERWQSSFDLKVELQGIAAAVSLPGGSVAATPGLRMRERFAWLMSALAIVTALILVVLRSREAPAVAPLLRLSIPRPEKVSASVATAISPDGRFVAFADESAGGMLWIRPLDSLIARALPGTDDARHPFWSPDGRFIGFFAAGKLKKIDVSRSEAGPPQTLGDAPGGRGGTWSRNDVILFSPNLEDAIYRVSAAGGSVTPVTMLDRSRRQTSHRWPDFLPDGRHFLYWVRSAGQETQGIYVGSLDDAPESQVQTRLLSSATNALYAAPGYLLFAQEAMLMARAFDASRLQFTGEPARLVSELGSASNNRVDFTVSANGLLAYESGDVDRQLVWFDRAGAQVGSVDGSSDYQNPQLSPDGKRVAIVRLDPQNAAGDIWVLELSRGTASRLTTDPSFDWTPLWSPDGQRLVFASNRKGAMSLYERPSSPGPDQVLLDTGNRMTPTDWSRDGRFVVYAQVDPKTKEDLWALPLDRDRKPFPILRTDFNETDGRLSPDGRWMAYTSDESGTAEVYVQRFTGGEDATASRIRVSTSGGSNPRWRRDGRELFYINGARKLVSVAVRSTSTFEVDASQALFDVSRTIDPSQVYTATPDGQRFLVGAPPQVRSPIIVMVNWLEELKAPKP